MTIRNQLGRALLLALVLPACGGGDAAPASVFGAAGAGGGAAGGTAGGTALAGAPAGGTAGASGGSSLGGVMNGAGAGGLAATPAGAGGMGGQPSAGSGGASEAGAAMGGGGGGGGTAGAGVGGATDAPAIKAVMYLPNWAGSFASWAGKLDFNEMTHLDLAFGTIKAGTNDWSLGAPDADVKAIALAAHQKGVKVLVSIGGADDDIGIINRYQTAANIDPMVANLDALITRLDLDGVDVDLERGNALKASGNFPAFLSKLIATLRPQGRVVSCALAQYIIEDTGDDAATTKKWLDTYDFINLMIYNPNMSTYTKELAWWTTQRNIDKSKLTWGVEFSSKTSVDYAKQLTTASKAYGGIMAWELSQATAPALWKAIQDTL